MSQVSCCCVARWVTTVVLPALIHLQSSLLKSCIQWNIAVVHDDSAGDQGPEPLGQPWALVNGDVDGKKPNIGNKIRCFHQQKPPKISGSLRVLNRFDPATCFSKATARILLRHHSKASGGCGALRWKIWMLWRLLAWWLVDVWCSLVKTMINAVWLVYNGQWRLIYGWGLMVNDWCSMEN